MKEELQRRFARGPMSSDGPVGDWMVRVGGGEGAVWVGPGRVLGGCRGSWGDVKTAVLGPDTSPAVL